MDDSGKITAFDKAHYDQLITYLTGVDDDINTNTAALGPSADMKLNDTLDTRIHPGGELAEAKLFKTKAHGFGNSVAIRYKAIEKDMRTFSKALKDAEEVFDQTNDLATYDASKFGQQYPDVSGQGAGTGTGSGSGSGGDTGTGTPG